MKINFTKMHGCGNDYVYINGFDVKIAYEAKPELVRRLSDRHFGIGSDGVIFINPSESADFEMEMWNADGTRAQMCGNGIRCVAKYVCDRGMTDKTELKIESYGAIKYITVYRGEDGLVGRARVDMGEPVLEAEKIPVRLESGFGKCQSNMENIAGENADGRAEKQQEKSGGYVIAVPVEIVGREYRMTCVSMGNPHAVIFEDPDKTDLEHIGPLFEHNEHFPERVNTEFVKIIDRENVQMRVWERGAGETLACGTGCCAVCAACVLNGLTERKISVHLPGGTVETEWDEQTGHIFMTGPAETVFDGEIKILPLTSAL